MAGAALIPRNDLAGDREIRPMTVNNKAFLSPFFILIFGLSSARAEVKVLLSSTSVLAGDTLRVELDDVSTNLRFRAMLSKKYYPFYLVGPNTQRALLGIPLATRAGAYSLDIKLAEKKPGAFKLLETQTVVVSPRTLPVDQIAFSKEKTRLLTSGLDRKESKKIHKILKILTRQQFWEGAFDYPVHGKVVGEFGQPRVYNGQMDEVHKGIDLEVPAGTPVLAPNVGVVMLARAFQLHGRTVILNHGQGVMTIYLHMKSFVVKPAQKVVKGQRIGTVGSSGLSTAPHVHWGLYVHGAPVDPKPWTEREY